MRHLIFINTIKEATLKNMEELNLFIGAEIVQFGSSWALVGDDAAKNRFDKFKAKAKKATSTRVN